MNVKYARFRRGLTVIALIGCFLPRVAFADDGNAAHQSAIAWNKMLLKECPIGQPEHAVRRLMNGKHCDMAVVRSNAEVHQVMYLIDDFHQVTFMFDKSSSLLITPTVEPRQKWLRLPNGDVLLIMDSREKALKSSAEDSALRFVMERTVNARESLCTYCTRNPEDNSWDVVISIKSLEVDTPTYLLKVTDRGEVSSHKPISIK